jgi:hypothetical protein
MNVAVFENHKKINNEQKVFEIYFKIFFEQKVFVFYKKIFFEHSAHFRAQQVPALAMAVESPQGGKAQRRRTRTCNAQRDPAFQGERPKKKSPN